MRAAFLAATLALTLLAVIAGGIAHAQDTPGPPSPTEQPGDGGGAGGGGGGSGGSGGGDEGGGTDSGASDEGDGGGADGSGGASDGGGDDSGGDGGGTTDGSDGSGAGGGTSGGSGSDDDGGDAPQESEERTNGDVEGITGESPMCSTSGNDMAIEAGGVAQRNCRRSGSIAQPHPTANYGLDQHVKTELTKPETMFAGVVHAVCQAIWMGLVYLVRVALLLVELGFSNDLVNRAMGEIERGLGHLRAVFLTESWQVAAFSVLGVWGIWMGLVRRKTINTVGGLATAVGLMIVAQVIIQRPADTVGHVASLSSDGALVALSAASTGTVDRPAQSFASAHQGLFTTLIVRPWCALQFTDVDGCMQRQQAKGQPQTSIADLWLTFAANSRERDKLYDNRDKSSFKLEFTKKECKRSGIAKWLFDDIAADDSPAGKWGEFTTWACERWRGMEGDGREVALKYDDDEAGLHTDASIQSADGAFTRLAMLGLIALGLIGAIAVLLWIGVRLLLAGLFSLVLILMTPLVFLMAAFGEAGRRAVVAWAQRLFGLLVAKFVYAMLLAVVVLVANVIQSLDFPWPSTWALFIAYWWGLLLKRDQLLGFMTLDRRSTEGGAGLAGGGSGTSLSSMYYGWRMARDGLRLAWAPAGKAIGAGREHAAKSAATAADKVAERDAQTADRSDAAHERDRDDRGAQTAAIRDHDRDELGAEGRRGRDVAQQRDDMRSYREKQRERRRAAQELRANRERQQRLARKIPHGHGPLTARQHRAVAEREALKRREHQLLGKLDSWRNDPSRTRPPVLTPGDPLKGRELDDYIAARREEVATLPPEHERNLVAAGIDPDRYRRAGADERRQLRERSAQTMERSRTLLATATTERPLAPPELSRAWDRIDAGPRGARTRERAAEGRGEARRATTQRNADRAREEARRTREHDRERRARRREDELRSRSRRGMR